jgi:hypothetical protein
MRVHSEGVCGVVMRYMGMHRVGKLCVDMHCLSIHDLDMHGVGMHKKIIRCLFRKKIQISS